MDYERWIMKESIRAIVHNAFNQYDSLMGYIETGHDE